MAFEEKLDITNFKNSANNFYKTLEHMSKVEKDIKNGDFADDQDFLYGFYRAAMIQTFETTIESSWKIMQRWIKINADNKIHEKPKREMFRTAHQSGLISDPVQWWEFYEGRNKTAHTYHDETAQEVYELVKTLKQPLQKFEKNLKERI